ncbi:hypothetical protein M9H77_20182 [Catharanthus roseus]|uniref:Uncharacterized protein n=1 Tax=Catharanthus roseus TaxID=4058 RepID=A0ACC0AJV4_CATRO|nr:hypothetical protein M9H77_20182 [Catharanthus roseus]
MGVCISCSSNRSLGDDDSSTKPNSAYVVSIGGDLRQYSVPITVSQVLQSELISPSSSSPGFLCNSDRLYFDSYIPALKPHDELQSGQIYFVLPESKLQYKLTASDMAALAVKASVALQSQNSRRKKNKKARISPVLINPEVVEEEDINVNVDTNNNNYYYSISMKKKQRPSSSSSSSSGLGVSRSGSVRKLQRYSSRRAKLAVRSFRIKLTTIYEGVVNN